MKTLSLEELENQFQVIEKLEKILPDFRTATPFDDEYDFMINTDEIVYIKKGNQHSYTFSIIREEPIPGLENLVLNYEQGDYTAYRIRYDFTAAQLVHPDHLESQETRVIITPFDPESSVTDRKRPNPCYKWEKREVAWNEQGQATHSEWVQVIDQDCMDQLNSGGQTSNSATSGGTSGGLTSNGGTPNGAVPNAGWGGWMGTGVNTGVYNPPSGTDNSGYTGGSSDGHHAGHTGHDTSIPNLPPPKFDSGDSNSGAGDVTVFTKPVFKLKFALSFKLFKTRMKSVVPDPLWWRTTNGKKISEYLKQHFDNQTGLIDIKTSEFAVWAIGYLVSHPEVTWEQFENWFLGEVEGQDGEYDSEFWDNPDLTFPQQQLPSFYDFNSAYPRIKGKELAQLIGGEILDLYTKYPNSVRGYCALKVSRALNYSGITIPHIVTTKDDAGTVSGDDGKYYFLNAKALNKWMQKTFGISPDNPFHIRISGSEGGIKGENFPKLTAGLKGIYSMVSSNSKWASGHADLIKGDGTCVNGCHFYDTPPAPIAYIDIWILN